MDQLVGGVDWGAVLLPGVPVVETLVRGTITYLSLFVLLRVILKRQSGAVGITDLLVVVLIADAAQNAMAGDYRSISDGLILVVTILFWSYVLDWLGYHFPRLQRIVHPAPLPLIQDGKLLWQNMRRELITKDELMTELREQGISEPSEVKEAHMEGSGQISVITYDKERHDAPEQKGAL